MAQFKVAIRKQENKDGNFNIKIRLTHKGETRYIGTDFYVRKNQINDSGPGKK